MMSKWSVGFVDPSSCGLFWGRRLFFHQDIWAAFAWLEAGLTDVLTSAYFLVTNCNLIKILSGDLL